MSKSQIVKQAVLAVPTALAGMVFVACAGPSYESGYAIEDNTKTEVVRVDQTGFQESSGAAATTYRSDQQAGQQAGQQAAQQQYQATTQQAQAGQEFGIPLHEEQMQVGKQQVKAGQVTLRKVVTTQTVSQPVELRRETLIIDRSGGAQVSGSAASSASASSGGASQQQAQQGQQINEASGAAGPFQEQSYTIELFQEQPVVQKNIVETGRVSAHKAAQMQTQNVQGQVRREDIQVDKSGNVQIQEISGAQQQQLQEPAGAQPSQQQKDAEMELRRQEQLRQDELQKGKSETSEPGEENSVRGGARDLQQYDNPTDYRFDRQNHDL
jgi:stress response protein YsnF